MKIMENHVKIVENHGKIMREYWENHGKDHFLMDFFQKQWENISENIGKLWESIGKIMGNIIF